MIVAAIALVIGGLVVAGAGRLGLKDRLPRQHWAGMRTKTTLATDDTWVAAHRASGRATVTGGVVMVLGGISATVSNPDEETAAGILMGTLAVAGVAITVGAVRGQRAARDALEMDAEA